MRRPLTALVAIGALIASNVMSVRGADEDCFYMKLNAERRAVGVPALTWNPKVAQVAEAHSMEMAMRDTIYHNPNLAEELPPFRYAGENVGEGPDCATIHEAFRSSPGHYANMTDPDYTQVGIGVAYSDDQTTLFVTEDFFAPAPTAKPRPRPSVRRSTTSRPRCV